MCVSECHVCVVCLCSSKETTEAAGPGLPGSCELPNTGPGNEIPEEQQVLLSAEPSPPIAKNLFSKSSFNQRALKIICSQKLARDFFIAAASQAKGGNDPISTCG